LTITADVGIERDLQSREVLLPRRAGAGRAVATQHVVLAIDQTQVGGLVSHRVNEPLQRLLVDGPGVEAGVDCARQVHQQG
jgi:hypothetical protein